MLVLFLICQALASERADPFESFIQKYGKSYSTEEYAKRQAIFMENLAYIQENTGKGGVHLSVNEFADMTHEEFKTAKLVKRTAPASRVFDKIEEAPMPPTWNWQTKGAVTPVVNQGQDGAEIFALVDSVSGCYFMSTKKLVVLSYDQVAECTPGHPHGFLDPYWKYILGAPGLDSNSCYPPNPNGGCQFSKSCCVTAVTSVIHVHQGNETALQFAVYQNPVAATIDASLTSFQFYNGGVYYDAACGANDLDHEVLVVGWGVLNGVDYWLVKNSWGTDWGLEGYIMMARNRDNNCGIASLATYPQGCTGCRQ